jgi:hypothetical protein
LKADLEGLIVCSKLNTRNISQPDWESPACFKTPIITKKSLFYTKKDFVNSDNVLQQSHCLLDADFCLLGSFSGDVQTNVIKILEAACSTL